MSFPSSPLPSSHVSDSNSAIHSPDAIAPPESVADKQATSVVSTSVEIVSDAAVAPISTTAEPIVPALALNTIERRAGRAAAWQASVPAVLLLALGAAANQAPLSKPLPLAQVERVSSAVAAGVVAPGETMIVSAKNVSGSSILRGRLQFAGGVSGRAPLSGAISRVLVREGQFVQVNDRVLQIATSTGSRRVRRVERVQSSAESAQVRAVNAQAALQSRLAGAQSRLEAARGRVARAGVRVAQAQEIVQKLQRGETVAIPDTDGASSRRESTSRRARRRSARRLERRESASRVVQRRDSGASREALSRALRESKSAMRAADAAQSEVESARRAAEEAGNAVGAKTQQAAEARAAVESAQKRLADGTGKEADVEAAKAAVAAAEADADAARARVADARKTVAAKESAASSARAAADQAASEAARADRKLELFSSQSDAPRGDASKEEAQDAKTSGDDDEREAQGEVDAGVSPVARAARLVEAALQESSEAIREARRLKADVEKYDRQVKATNHRLDTTGRDLEAAQQTVLDDTIQTRLSSVRAPSSGTVLSIASLAEEVGEGEAIITIGRSSSLRVRFADYSGVWKNLKPGALLTASVQPALDQSSAAPIIRFRSGANRTATKARAASARRALPNAAKRGKSGTSGAIPVSGKVPVKNPVKKVANSGGVAIVARLRAVEAPRRPGQPAIMEAVIFNPRRLVATPNGLRRRRVFRPGMAILCSIDKPGKRRVISVPSGAIVRDAPDGNRGWIAVLTPAPSPALVPPARDDAAVAPRPSASAEAVAPGLVTSDDASDDVARGSDSARTETHGAQRETLTETPQGIDNGSWLRIELRHVVLGPSDGVQQEIANGLHEGERIALRPAALRALTARFGSRAAVRLQPEDERAPGA